MAILDLDTFGKKSIFWVYVGAWVLHYVMVHASMVKTNDLNFTSVVFVTSFVKIILCVGLHVYKAEGSTLRCV